MHLAGGAPEPDDSIDSVMSPGVAEPAANAPQPPSSGLRRVTKAQVFPVEQLEAEALWSVASAAADDESVSLAEVASSVPERLRQRLQRFAGRGRWLLVRGLLPTAGPARADVAHIVLRATMSVLGTTSAQHGEAPLAAGLELLDPCRLSTTPWHVAEVDLQARPDFVGMLCRSQPSSSNPIRFATVSEMDLATIARVTLEQPRFALPALEPESDGAEPSAQLPVAVLSGSPSDLQLRVDARILRPADPRDRQAETSLRHLYAQLGSRAVGHVPAVGDLLVLDNLRVPHAPLAERDCIPYCDVGGPHMLHTLVQRSAEATPRGARS